MKFARVISAALLTSLCVVPNADAWEPTTTHPGFTESSALGSGLHKTIQDQLGFENGLFAILTVPKGDAPELFRLVRLLNPIHGYVPDSRGRMTALSWLSLGSVIADSPASAAGNHFFDPRSKKGLTHDSSLTEKVRSAAEANGPELRPGGLPATEWWNSPKNPLGYHGFTDQYLKAVTAKTQEERDRHLAGALMAAGAMLHVLQDMGSPSHVRNDLAAHETRIGPDDADKSSRFEYIASLSFGRLGIPAPVVISGCEGDLACHFSNADGKGLADWAERNFFSKSTMPRTIKVRRDTGSSVVKSKVNGALRRPAPAIDTRLDIVAARNPKGATLRNEAGTCLARYHWQQSRLRWSVDDACSLEQMQVIMPVVAGYGVSFLKTLFPDDLSLASTDGKLQVVTANAMGRGQLRAFADNGQGKRKEFHAAKLRGGQGPLASLPTPPPGTTRVTVLFEGATTAGHPIMAAASDAWPLSQTPVSP